MTDVRPTCTGTTRSGTPCRNRAVDGTGFCRRHHPDPNKRPSKGVTFEKSCLKALRLLGYVVERNVTLHGCQIDVLAVYRTGVIPLRLMVECKDYGLGRNVGVTEVKEFAGILHSALGTAVDKGLLITAQGFTREAKEFADSCGIQLVTFTDLATQLVPFEEYVDRIISQYESLDVSHYYIPLSASHTEDYDGEDESTFERPLVNVVDRLLFSESRDKIALLGNFGTGKSTFCQKYAYELAKRYRTDGTSRIPILVNLSDYESNLDIQELVTNTLQFRYGVRIDLVLCQELQRQGRFVLLFDGFDEMATRVDPDIVRDNLREINKISRIEENKFILTCRTHFFRDRVQAEVLAEFDLLYIPEWRDRELTEYLQKRLGKEWRKHLKRIHGTHNLTELAQTPLFTEMIVETLPSLGNQVRRASLYRAYTDKWIQEQSRRRGARLSPSERKAVVSELSNRMYADGRSSCHYTEIMPILQQRIKTVDAAKIDYLESDVRTCTFLTRDVNGNYRFRHKSFMEFFVAQSISEDVIAGNAARLSAKVIPVEVRGFLIDLLRDNPPADNLRAWLRDEGGENLRNNSLSLATALRIDLDDINLAWRSSGEFDTEVVAKFLQGDTSAFESIMQHLKGPIRALVRSRSFPSLDADEILVETLMKLWQNRERIDQVKDIRPYAFRIARNLMIDKYRKESRMAHFPQEALLGMADVAIDTPQDTSLINMLPLKEALAQLSEKERRIIEGTIMEGEASAELAKELDTTVSNIYKMKSRAVKKLRDLLRDSM